MLIKDPQTGTEIDVSLGAMPVEGRAVSRSSLRDDHPEFPLRICSAEDLIVYKCFANRTLDRHDVKGVLIRQGGALDFDLIESELTPLVGLKDEPDILTRWTALRQRYV